MRKVAQVEYFSYTDKGIIKFLSAGQYWPAMRKLVFGHMRTAKAKISLRIRAVWSGPSLSANRIIGDYRMYQWRANAWMGLCACAGWISAFCACSKTPFLWHDPYIIGGKYTRHTAVIHYLLFACQKYKCSWINWQTGVNKCCINWQTGVNKCCINWQTGVN